jgi:hypothetical protein
MLLERMRVRMESLQLKEMSCEALPSESFHNGPAQAVRGRAKGPASGKPRPHGPVSVQASRCSHGAGRAG